MNKEKGRGKNRYRGLMVGIGTRGTDQGMAFEGRNRDESKACRWLLDMESKEHDVITQLI